MHDGEGVFIRLVVADVQRHDIGPIQSQIGEQPAHGAPLVPGNVGPQLEQHLATRFAQQLRCLGHGGVHGLLDDGSVLRCHAAIVGCNGEALTLDQRAADVGQVRTHALLGAIEHGQQLGRALVLLVQTIGTADIETVTADIDQAVEADHTRHVGALAAADDGHGAAPREVVDGAAHGVIEASVARVRDDRCQGAVVVEEDRRALALKAARDRRVVFEGVGQQLDLPCDRFRCLTV